MRMGHTETPKVCRITAFLKGLSDGFAPFCGLGSELLYLGL